MMDFPALTQQKVPENGWRKHAGPTSQDGNTSYLYTWICFKRPQKNQIILVDAPPISALDWLTMGTKNRSYNIIFSKSRV